MTTIINNPGESTESSAMSIISGIIAGLLLITLFIVYFLPVIQNKNAEDNTSTIKVELPGNTPAK